MAEEHLKQQLFDEQDETHHIYATDSDNHLNLHHDAANQIAKSNSDGVEYQDVSQANMAYGDVAENGGAIQDVSENQEFQENHDLDEPNQGFVIREQDRWLPIANGELVLTIGNF